MHILIGIALALALLYFWLLGHWFARVLMFLIITATGGILALATGTASSSHAGLIPPLAIAAWFMSGLPLYYWRHQNRYG
jgi:hypothetical protein